MGQFKREEDWGKTVKNTTSELWGSATDVPRKGKERKTRHPVGKRTS